MFQLNEEKGKENQTKIMHLKNHKTNFCLKKKKKNESKCSKNVLYKNKLR